MRKRENKPRRGDSSKAPLSTGGDKKKLNDRKISDCEWIVKNYPNRRFDFLVSLL